jgi:hypothetical protein
MRASPALWLEQNLRKRKCWAKVKAIAGNRHILCPENNILGFGKYVLCYMGIYWKRQKWLPGVWLTDKYFFSTTVEVNTSAGLSCT